MNDDDQSVDGESLSNEPVTIGKRDLAQLRKAAKAAGEAQGELSTLKRQMAFIQAGVDPADKQLSYFVKAYDGELDPAKIQEAALDAGFRLPGAQRQQEAPPPQQQFNPQGQQFGQQQYMQPMDGPTPAELAALARMNSATQGAPGAFASNEAAFQNALATAKSPGEIMEAIQRFGLPVPGIS